VRENTECLYVKNERIIHEETGRRAIAERHITEKASLRIARMVRTYTGIRSG
jgi:isocitrate/isopropylmalate dehydrogenase